VAEYLIDTHIFLWAIDAPKQLLRAERNLLEDSAIDVAVSVASFWELSVKLRKGSLQLKRGTKPIADDYFFRQATQASFSILPIDAPEAEYVRRLPNFHKDPFDRLLIAQALLQNRIVMTRDAVFHEYPGVHVF
jgi:PIN domain nuclease of toxin-antitoxin system